MTVLHPSPTVSSFAALHVDMLWPRRPAALPFPFDQPGISYYYLARNGIYALADAWRLRGEELLVPAYCHGVEMRALLAAGVHLRYYPVHAGMTVSVDDVLSRVTPRTRGVYLIHYAGFPGPVEELADACRRLGLLLIEDCALALLSKKGDVPLGSLGDASIFCLYKTLPVPNGGAVVLKSGQPLADPTTAPSLASTFSYALSAALRQHHVEHPPEEESVEGGRWLTRDAVKPLMEKLGMVRVATEDFDAAHAALGMSRLCHTVIAAQDFAGIVERRRRNFSRLLSRLSGVVRPVRGELPDGVCPLFFPIQTAHKVEVQRRLADRGIETVNVWAADAPGVRPGEFAEVDELRHTVLELPCHQDMTIEAVDRVADEVIKLGALVS